MSFTKPVVIDNQQVIALDFNDLADLPEELLRRFIQNLVVDTSTYGWVIHGLAVTDTSAGAVTSVQIGAGACILPSSAGDDGYRLVIVPANIDVPLTLPGAGTRTDVIQIVLQETATENAARFVRSLGPGGEPQAVQQNINTRLRVTGVQGVNEGGGTVASPGAVRLASVAMDVAEITGITDRRTYALPAVPFGSFLASKFASVADMAFYLSGVLSNVYDRLGVNIGANGKLKEAIQPSAGADITIDGAAVDLGGRSLAAGASVFSGAVISSGTGTFGAVNFLTDDDAWFDDSGASTMGKIGRITRAVGHAHVSLAWNGGGFDFTSVTTSAHYLSVVRDSAGRYTVTLNQAELEERGQSINGGKYAVQVSADPYTEYTGAADGDVTTEAQKFVLFHTFQEGGSGANEFRVAITLADAVTYVDRSFNVVVRGPFL